MGTVDNWEGRVAIECKVGTSYQMRSIKAFGIPLQRNGQGECFFRKVFEYEQQAKNFLQGIAQENIDDDQDLGKAMDDIQKGFLTIDAATAYIVDVPEEK